MPIYGHTFFDHNSVIFWPIKLKFHMATQETIIYRLVLKNLDQDRYFQISDFGVLIWPKKGRGSTLSHKGLGPQDPTKKLAQGMELLDHVLSQNHASKNFRPGVWTPPPLRDSGERRPPLTVPETDEKPPKLCFTFYSEVMIYSLRDSFVAVSINNFGVKN